MAGVSAQALPNYPQSIDVTIDVPYVDFNGSPVNGITAVSYRVTDEAGNELLPLTPLENFTVGDTEATITVPAALNVLPAPPPVVAGVFNTIKQQLRGMRVVEVTMTVPAGTITANAMYIVAFLEKLVLLDNSFQTYEESILNSLDMPRLPGFEAASDSDRIQALTEAYFRLTRLGYRVLHPSFVDSPPAGGSDFWPDNLIPPRYWQVMSMAYWNNLLPEFHLALKRAQIAEANVILAGDPITQRRRDGLMSETIGQSSMMFRSGKPLILPVSQDALAYLTNYVEFRKTISRT